LFKKKREQADMIERVFREIRIRYKKTDISHMKDQLQFICQQAGGCVEDIKICEYLDRFREMFRHQVMNGQELTTGGLVKDFIVEPPPPINLDADDEILPTGTEDVYGVKRVEEELKKAEKPIASRIPPPPPPIPTIKSPGLQPSGSQRAIPSIPGFIPRGNLPQVRVSPDRTDVQICYHTAQPPSVDKLLTLTLGKSKETIPLCIKSLDDRILVVGCADGVLKVIDLGDNGTVRRILQFGSRVRVIEGVEDANGKNPMMKVAVGLGVPEFSLVFVELQSKETSVVKMKGHQAEISGVVVIGNGEYASCDLAGFVHLWSEPRNTRIATIQAHQCAINGIGVLGGRLLVTGSDDSTLKVYDISQRELKHKHTLIEKAAVKLVTPFHGNAKYALSCLVSGVVRIWNVDDGE